METPPNNTGVARPNFMQFRRGDAEEDLGRNDKNEMMMKFGPSMIGLIVRVSAVQEGAPGQQRARQRQQDDG